jgi:hypothetical protein
MLYSKKGSIPKPETDGTSGWVEVPNPPVAPPGKEVVWWWHPGWVVRDPQPGPNWSWSQTEERWIEYPEETIEISLGSAIESVEVGSADIIIQMPSAGVV